MMAMGLAGCSSPKFKNGTPVKIKGGNGQVWYVTDYSHDPTSIDNVRISKAGEVAATHDEWVSEDMLEEAKP